jgi:Na+-transporting NADH:ubiquinone oxidoreductase subunit C
MSVAGRAGLADQQRNRGDGITRVLSVAILVSLVCSIVVASAAVLLKPRQLANEQVNRQRNVLAVAGLLTPGADVAALFERIEPRLVEFASANLVPEPSAESFDELRAARDPDLGVAVPAALDVARVGRRARFGKIYLVRDEGAVVNLILPVRGAGLWSTMYGFIALAPDGVTITGISFYEHAETPGLGDQIDDPRWRASWQGKQAFDSNGVLRLVVIKGRVQPDAVAAPHQIDGLSGATLTGNGVTNLVRYWLGEHGYGPFLRRLQAGDITL